MALLGNQFAEEFKNVKEADFEPIPEGNYLLKVTETDLKETKDGGGSYIKVTFEVIGPSHQGRKLFANFNITNRSAEAERIGRQQLKNLTTAAGITAPLIDSDQLVGATAKALVKIRPAKDGYEAQNDVSRFKPVNEAPVVGGGVFTSNSPAPAAPTGGAFSAAFAKPAAPAQAPAAAPAASFASPAAGSEAQPWKF